MTETTKNNADPSSKLILAALPLASWLLVFLLAPIAMVFIYSFFQRGPYGNIIYEFSLSNYVRVFDPLYLAIFLRSGVFAIVSTVICVALGFPVAYAIATVNKAWRPWLFLGLMIPFLTNFVVRVYAVRILLSVEGPLNGALLAMALIPAPLLLNDSTFSVVIGMITSYLPFMVLPIFVVLDKLDFSIVEAANDLGAGWPTVMRQIVIPLARPGIISGCALVLIPVLGEFMIPDLLGGAKTMLIGNLITEQFLKARDWPFGAALSMVLVFLMLIMLVLNARLGVSIPGRSQQ